MRSSLPLAAFAVVVLLGAGSPLRGDQAKSLDCLQVFVEGSDSAMVQSKPPMRVREVHVVFKNICSVDITAFELETDIKSPVEWKRKQGDDMVFLLHPESPVYNKIPRAGQDFPYDVGLPDDLSGESPFEGTIRVVGLAFRDETAVGDAAWIKRMNERRKGALKEFSDELDLLVKVARLDNAKALLQGEPDISSNEQFKAFWRETQQSVGNDPVKWRAFVNWRVHQTQLFIDVMKEQSELRREGN